TNFIYFDYKEEENKKEIIIKRIKEDINDRILYFTYTDSEYELCMHIQKDVDIDSITHAGIKNEHIVFIQ
ncbi:MAG: hypothetical protein HUJ53_08515, partial [Holdemanella sp.]|nr:hypothetical protein [Holdemanella sp.]